MARSVDVCLAVTVHDPDERWLARFAPALGEVAALYPTRAATCTGATSARTSEALQDAGFIVVRTAYGTLVGENRRRAIRTLVETANPPMLHYCDLDRLLHWQRRFPAELRGLITSPPRAHYTALGRTGRAWRSHPPVQVLTERLTNAAIVAALGLERTADFTAGSCLLSRRAGEVILAGSIEPANGTDLEWPALAYRGLGERPHCALTEGLEFETADYYADEIAADGSRSAWLRRVYERPAAWLERTEMARQSIAALTRVLDAGA
jgi:hypothetical protein